MKHVPNAGSMTGINVFKSFSKFFQSICFDEQCVLLFPQFPTNCLQNCAAVTYIGGVLVCGLPLKEDLQWTTTTKGAAYHGNTSDNKYNFDE